jgi:hypothetical protein
MIMDMPTLRFDSIVELADHAHRLNTGELVTGHRYGTTSTDDNTRHGQKQFYGGFTLEQAIECGLSGGNWQEGADAMPRLELPHETLSGAPLPEPTMGSDIVGFSPCVPNYLAGQPDSMLSMSDIPAGDKLIKVGVHVGRQSAVTQEHILNRGAAILSVLNQLQLEGYAVELTALWRNSDSDGSASIETIVKGATDFWSPEAVSFAICHAGFQRRLCWRVAESLQGAKHTGNGYGNGMKTDLSDFDISFPYITDDEARKHYRTSDKAVARVKAQALKQLNNFQKAA